MAWTRGMHFARKFLSHTTPLAYTSATAEEWPALLKAFRRAGKASYLRVEWARQPGSYIVWATAELPGAEMLPPDHCVGLLGTTLQAVCKQVEDDAAGERSMWDSARRGKRARLLTSSRDWRPPKKEPSGDWKRVGIVRWTADPEPVVECLRRHGIAASVRQGLFSKTFKNDGTLHDAEWVVAWEWPNGEGWDEGRIEAVLVELGELSGSATRAKAEDWYCVA
jgi:hypothetical protein